MNRELRRALLILLAGVALVTGVVGAGAYFTLRATADTLRPELWSDQLLARSDVPRVFGVRFAERPARFRVRRLELTDAAWEVLAELGDEAAAQRFVALNALQPAGSEAAPELDAAEEELQRLTAQRVQASHSYQPVPSAEFEREVTVLEAGGSRWVLLDATALQPD